MTIKQNQHVKEKYKKIGDTKSANLTDLSLEDCISTTVVVGDRYIINLAHSWWFSIQGIVSIIRRGNCSLRSSLW